LKGEKMKQVTKAISIFTIVVLALALMPVGSVLAATGPVTTDVLVTPNPVALNGTVNLTATITAEAGLTVAWAAYTLNGGAPVSIAGTFGTQVVNIATTFKATKSGLNTVCVYGVDSATYGVPVCTDFTVNFNFKGFQSPIRMNVVNKANAGRTVPIKFWLTDANGKPISKSSAITTIVIKSYEVDCTTLTGDPATAVLGSSPGKSGLKYQGKGRWMINWKTDKAFKGTCRKMFVTLNEVQNSPEVVFAFK
jgi:hypothetical protein